MWSPGCRGPARCLAGDGELLPARRLGLAHPELLQCLFGARRLRGPMLAALLASVQARSLRLLGLPQQLPDSHLCVDPQTRAALLGLEIVGLCRVLLKSHCLVADVFDFI